jgi:hypothetical protein
MITGAKPVRQLPGIVTSRIRDGRYMTGGDPLFLFLEEDHPFIPVPGQQGAPLPFCSERCFLPILF